MARLMPWLTFPCRSPCLPSALRFHPRPQVVHDVALQKLPVRFAMDRAGLVGADGATHCGAFDVAFMANLPSMVCMASSNEAELAHMVATAAAIDDRPSCFRFPRGNGLGLDLAAHGVGKDFKGTPLEIGKALVCRTGKDVALLAYGSSVNDALAAAELLTSAGVSATVVDARFCKPLDTALIRQLAREHPVLISIEEGAIGGFASHVMQVRARHCGAGSARRRMILGSMPPAFRRQARLVLRLKSFNTAQWPTHCTP